VDIVKMMNRDSRQPFWEKCHASWLFKFDTLALSAKKNHIGVCLCLESVGYRTAKKDVLAEDE
jgi:hypothetical protein